MYSIFVILQTPAKNQHKVISLDTLSRGKRSISVNLKQKEGVSVVKRLTSSADVLIEPFRPGNKAPDTCNCAKPLESYVQCICCSYPNHISFSLCRTVSLIINTGLN